MYDDLHFAEPLYHDIAGRRFEPHFEPEWQAWCVIDRQCGRLHPCVDERSATREAASLEAATGGERGPSLRRVTMLHPGDRVLVLTSYGELPARVASVDAGRWTVHVEHPGLPPRIAVWDHEVRRPLDGAADERMKMPERLFTVQPAYLPEPLYYPGGEFGPRRPRRRA